MDNMRGIKRRPAPPSPDAFINQAKGGGTSDLDEVLAALEPTEKPKKERIVPFNLRLPEHLHAKLEAVSNATGKSMHEICMTLLVPALEKAHERYVP